MSIGIFPKLSQIFPDERYDDLNEILNDCPSEFVIHIASFINSKLFYRNTFEVEEEMFELIVNQEGISEIDKALIFKNIEQFKSKNNNKSLALFPLINVLKLIDYELRNFRVQDTLPNPQKELQILKALLYLNEKMDEEHIFKKKENTFHLLWTSALNQFEFRKQKDFETELYLSFSLFEYFKKQYPDYYSRYLSIFGCDDELLLLKKLILLFINSWNKDKKELQCLFPNDTEDKNSAIKPYIRDLYKHRKEEYASRYNPQFFKGLREKPILKLRDGKFLIINWNFLIDKFRQGLFFDFYNLSGLKEDLKFEDYKSIFGKEYSEKELFVKTLNLIFEDESIVRHSENSKKKWNFDYYLRIDNKIVLFEFKDIIMADSIKESNGDEIENYFNENFIETSKGQPKGITQLINQIIGLNENPDLVEDYGKFGLKKERLMLFPVIVFTDNTFSIPTLNSNLTEKFRDLFKKYKTDFFGVFNPTLISMSSFINYYYYFKENPSNLITQINSYRNYLIIKSLKMSQNPSGLTFLEKGTSFDDFLNINLKKPNDITETYAFNEVQKKLFPEEF